ncbi:MAG: DNA polymerase III subunit delta [Deltaproteobacteria bacterium]|nr:DNA polymerase III subunit delta [Candidatus Anaeroferrophillacea bacterium]
MLDNLRSCIRRADDAEGAFGCCLLYGDESFPLSLLEESLSARMRKNDWLTVERYDVSQQRLDEVLPLFDAPSLFAPRKIVVLTHLEALRKSDGELLAAWLTEHGAADGPFLFLSAAARFDARQRLYKTLKKLGSVIFTDKLGPADRRQLVAREAQRCEVACAAEVVDQLLHYYDNHLQLIAREIDKLSLYVGPGGIIDEETVNLLGCGVLAANIFVLTDEVGTGALLPALSSLHRLLETRTAALLVVAMLARHYRLLARTFSHRARKESRQTLAGAIEVPPFVADKLWRQVEGFSSRRLAGSFALLSAADRRLKSSAAPDKIVLEHLVMHLCRMASADGPAGRHPPAAGRVRKRA